MAKKWIYPDEVAIHKEGTFIKVYQYGKLCASFDLSDKWIRDIIHLIDVLFNTSIQIDQKTLLQVRKVLDLT